MADLAESSGRYQKILTEVEERVEALREQAVAIMKEKESILELLQDVQDNVNRENLTEADREDHDFNTERLVIRCLTVEVAVSTPRDQIQEDSFNALSKILDELSLGCKTDPMKYFEKVESCLNASLPEPVSANVDSRFQSKLLGCTVDDQKQFRKRLQSLHKVTKDRLHGGAGNTVCDINGGC